MPRLALVLVASLLSSAGTAQAADVRVVSSGGFHAALLALAPGFERQSGDHLTLMWGPSMGETHDAVPARLARHEDIDVVIMVGDALGGLMQQGALVPGSRVDLARSLIGAVVRAGAPHPDISTPERLKQTLLDAPSIAYSDSASGVYISTELFRRLGIEDQVAGKAHKIPAEPVAAVVARGDAAIGFQQIAELKPVHGVDILGPLPESLEKVTMFSAAIVAGAHEQPEARALIAYLSSAAAAAAIADTGLDPVTKTP